jgi:F-type H+-transporting ATPase subunit gamma
VTERLAETTRRIESVHQLELVVVAMRGIAASRAQQARALLPGVRAHAAVIAQAIRQVLTLVPQNQRQQRATTHHIGVILFCAEQGFAGAFSERMLNAVEAGVQAQDVFLIGTRGAMLADERQIPLVWHAAMVPHASLIPALTGRIADALYDWVASRAGHRVDLIVPIWAAGAVSAERRSLLPFDFSRFAVAAGAQPPLTTLPPELLLTRLAEEYVFAELCQAALTAFSAENEARVAAMLNARTNLEHMQSDLRALERQIRQEEITAEVVELASGARARERQCDISTGTVM